ncbi:MAG: hypothetical protein QOG64_350 [Acidimicrobiaceae bacterium]|nr:hypothetical protein [Acidimicrobiaceae bacterium]
MRVELLERSITVAHGEAAELELEIYNTSEIIDGVSARIIGLDRDWVTSQPAQLALFPDSSGRMTLRIGVPPEFPAGTHTVTVEVTSSVVEGATVHEDLQLIVTPYTEASLLILPAVRSGHRKARFTVLCENTGNLPVELTLGASDPERLLQYRFASPVLSVPPGSSVTTAVAVRAPRHLFGSELSRAITVMGSSPSLEVEAQASYRQRPTIARGVLTAVVLASIVLLWASAFLLGLTKVLGHDPLTKTAPASFFASSPSAAAAAANAAGGGGAAGGGAPAGAVSKTGVAKGIGGAVSGKATAKSTGQGVGRITVQAIRDTPTGPRLVSSAATQSDGTFAIDGLFPDNYKLRFTAQGFKDVWFPASPDASGAQPVTVNASGLTKDANAVIEGLPGSISGKIDTGEPTTPVPVTVTVRAESAGVPAAPVIATSDPQGNFTVAGLPTPATYDLSFAAAGYQLATLVQQLNGGEARITNTVRLTAGPGTISGVVTDGTNPLGGVIVTTTAAGQTVTSATPTAGDIGHFALTGLPTPATYLVTFAKDRFGAQTLAVELGPGQTRTDLNVTLVGGTGTVSGKVVDTAGTPIGGVTVTLGGGSSDATTKTLTAGSVGSFLVSGLPTPGDYTLTFTAPGFASETLPVSLTSNSFASGVNATLSRSVGRLVGTVHSDASSSPGFAGVTVSITDGTNARTTTTTSSPAGSYSFADLPSGNYSVTFSQAGYDNQTALVLVKPGQDATQDITMVQTRTGG